MRSLLMVLPFIALTFLSWGVYGPLLQEGKHAIENSSLRPFVGVGLAYFVIAVIVPLELMRRKKEKGFWSLWGTLLSLLAGSVGALGALGVILALTAGGKPIFVMPLVFGCAPVVNTLVTMWLSKTFKQINPIFIAGMVAVALGASGVLVFKPTAPAAAVAHSSKPAASEKEAAAEKSTEKETAKEAEKSAEKKAEKSAEKPAEEKPVTEKEEPKKEEGKASEGSAPAKAAESPLNVNVLLAIVMAALCWGSYGPVLHIGQMKMGGSRLRPFCCVGLAYFVIAVAAPLLILQAWDEPGRWTVPGTIWSVLAGTAGALGALGIILAFNFGGKPLYVMPLVFGFAPVVNTFTNLWISGTLSQINTPFSISLGIVILGAVTVLIFAPKPTPHAKPAAPTATPPVPPAPPAATTV